MSARALIVLASFALLSCRRPDDEAARCPQGATERGGACFVLAERCGPDQVPSPASGCTSVGVPACAEGFVSDGEAGCSPQLPVETCPSGKMALIGDTACRDVAPCGEGRFGDAPPSALHVDASASGVEGDGSAARPYVTIGQAIAAAPSGATIAIAAGTYVENLTIAKPLTIAGRCPSMVEVRGDPAKPTTYTINVIADATVRGLAITGPYQAISVRNGTVTLEGLWVHDAGEHGVDLQRPTSASTVVTLRNALVERNRYAGVLVLGARATLDGVVVRDNAPEADGTGGMGVNIGTWRKEAAEPVTVRRVLAERNHLAGIAVTGVRATIERAVLRDTLAEPSGAEARGLGVWNDPGNVNVGEVTMTDSFVAGNRGIGVHVVGAAATLERVVVRDQAARVRDGRGGDGIITAKGGALTLRDSVVRANRHVGVLIAGSAATVERCVIRDTAAATDERHGAGVAFTLEGARPASGSVLDTLLVGNRYLGAAVIGSTVTLERVIVDRTAAQKLDGKFGDGIAVATAIGLNGLLRGSLTMADVQIGNSARASVSVWGADLSVARSLLTCAAFDLEVSGDYTDRGDEPNQPFDLADQGENVCGCAAWTACKAQSSGLEPLPPP